MKDLNHAIEHEYTPAAANTYIDKFDDATEQRNKDDVVDNVRADATLEKLSGHLKEHQDIKKRMGEKMKNIMHPGAMMFVVNLTFHRKT